VLGSHSFIDTFEDQIVDKNIGDEFDVNVTFPEEYHAENLAGKPAVFKVKLNAITETELPELDDEFAEEVSEFDTLEAYKADIKKTLEFRKESAAKRAKQEAAIEKIAEAAEVDIPEQMIKYYQENMFNEMTQNLRYQGLDMNMYLKMMKTSKETMLENIKPDAIARIKNSLALDKIADYIIQEISKIKKMPVTLERIYEVPEEINAQAFMMLDLIISSERADCLISAITGLSRSKAEALISDRKVLLNGVEVTKKTAAIKPSDMIVIRGYGKFIYDEKGKETGSGNLHIKVKKYT
jgi:trigger factor